MHGAQAHRRGLAPRASGALLNRAAPGAGLCHPYRPLPEVRLRPLGRVSVTPPSGVQRAQWHGSFVAHVASSEVNTDQTVDLPTDISDTYSIVYNPPESASEEYTAGDLRRLRMYGHGSRYGWSAYTCDHLWPYQHCGVWSRDQVDSYTAASTSIESMALLDMLRDLTKQPNMLARLRREYAGHVEYVTGSTELCDAYVDPENSESAMCDIRQLAAEHGITLTVAWESRDTPEMQRAGNLSSLAFSRRVRARLGTDVLPEPVDLSGPVSGTDPASVADGEKQSIPLVQDNLDQELLGVSDWGAWNEGGAFDHGGWSDRGQEGAEPVESVDQASKRAQSDLEVSSTSSDSGSMGDQDQYLQVLEDTNEVMVASTDLTVAESTASVLRMYGDASSSGWGAYADNPEWPLQCSGPWSRRLKKLARSQDSAAGSCALEGRALYNTLHYLTKHPSIISRVQQEYGGRVEYCTDSIALRNVFHPIKPADSTDSNDSDGSEENVQTNVHMHNAVRDVKQLAAEFGLSVTVIWQPRTTIQMRYADMLSRARELTEAPAPPPHPLKSATPVSAGTGEAWHLSDAVVQPADSTSQPSMTDLAMAEATARDAVKALLTLRKAQLAAARHSIKEREAQVAALQAELEQLKAHTQSLQEDVQAMQTLVSSQALRRAALSAQALDSLTPSTADDWRLSDATYKELCANPVLQGRTPTLDVFASHVNTKVPGRFYSRYDCPGSLGVDAFQHPWGVIDGQRQLAYIHGPIYGPDKVQNGQTFDRILQKIEEDRVDCILIGTSYYYVRHLPSATKARVHLHPPGALVAPRGVTDGRHLMAAYILWDPQHSSQQATAVHAQMEKPTAAPSPSARPPSDTSKTDHTDVRLSDAVYQHLCAHPVLRGRTPTLDVFASHLNTKVPGRFYSLTDCPGSLGVDAFQHPWGMIGGEKQLAYIHGPIHSSASAKDTVERIINKVKKEQVDCILVATAGHVAAITERLENAVRARVHLKPPNLLISPSGKGSKRELVIAYVLWSS